MKNALDTFLHDNVALVTGAGSGIGRATAEKLAAVGARVGLFGRTRDELRDTADAIAKNGGNALVLEGDVTRADQLDDAVGALEREWGRLDVLVCNAGINGKWAPLEEMEESDWDETIDINLKGTFLSVRAALPLLRRNGGSVTIVSSVNGTRMFSNAGASAYATSKAGQVAFARMMALELARLRVRGRVPGRRDPHDRRLTRHGRASRRCDRLPVEPSRLPHNRRGAVHRRCAIVAPRMTEPRRDSRERTPSCIRSLDARPSRSGDDPPSLPPTTNTPPPASTQ
jgi:NAD(P)-dependent dehydrogenase (short-subunit alcohol dehydrogenase family)